MSETAVVPATAKPEKAKTRAPKKSDRELIEVLDGRRVVECNLCEKLCGSRTRIVNGVGPTKAKIAIIGDSPGEAEDERGRPFVGPAGQTLRNWLSMLGFNIDRDIYFDNAIKCHPEEGHTISAKEIRNCNEHLWTALREVNPDIIIAAGNAACQALLPANIAAEGITKLRGHVFWNEDLQRKIIPMFHPSAVLHDFGNEIFCLADLRKAAKELKHPTWVPEGLGEYIALLDVEEVEQVMDKLIEADVVAFDTETSHSASLSCEQAGDRGGLDWSSAQVLCISFCDEVGTGYIVPIVGQYFRQIWSTEDYGRVMKALRKFFASDTPKIAQNGKFDVHMLRELGVEVNEESFAFDTMLGYSLIHEAASHALEPMRSMFTTMPFYDGDVYDQSKGKKHMELADEDVLWTYAAADTDCTLRVAKEVNRLIEEEGEEVIWVFENILMPAQRVATHIEHNGVLIDWDLANNVIEECDLLIAQTERAFYQALPEQYHGVSLTSPQQMKKLLYVDLKLPKPPVLTDKGSSCKECRDRRKQHWYHTSTNKDAIKELVDAHPVIVPLQTVTQLRTLKKTFLLGEEGKGSGLLQHVKADGRIHTAYRCDLETGRWASSPNLQNIPNSTDDRPEIYKLIRKLFCAPVGRKLVECDFSQIELRILAYISGQTEMIEQFEHNLDFHTYTARMLWPNLDPDMPSEEWAEVHKDRRTGAKRVNFGIPYGVTAFGMSQWLHCTEEEAAKYIAQYMNFFTKVRDYFRKSDRDIKLRGIRKNAFGRRRHFHGVKTMTHFYGYKRMLGHMRREAYNYPIQSTAADILSLAMIAVDNDPWYAENDIIMVLSVHDSITLEAPAGMAEECARRTLKHFLEAGQHLTYVDEKGQRKPYYTPGDAKWGQRWSDWEFALDTSGKVKDLRKAA